MRADPASGRLLSGSFDYSMMVWDGAGETPRLLNRFADHDGAVNAVAFLREGDKAVSGSDGGSVTLWDLRDGRLLHRFEGHTAKVVALAISPDGRSAASASWDRTARLWDLGGLRPGPVMRGHQGPVNAATFSADGTTLYTASADGTIGSWDVATGNFKRPVYRHGWGINVLQRLPSSERLLFGALNGSVGIVDAAAGALIGELKPHTRPVLALAVREPALIATGGGDGVIRVFRDGGGSLVEEYQNPYGPVWALAFAPRADALYYGGLDDFAVLWTYKPREPYEAVDSPFPRRFQLSDDATDPVAQGQLQFARKCSICHTLKADGANRAGPTLHRIFGRRVGSLPGYPYSEALKNIDIVWSEDTIARLFELGPEHYTPGSKMPLQRIADTAQRAALIAYLKIATAGEGSDDPISGPRSSAAETPAPKGERK